MQVDYYQPPTLIPPKPSLLSRHPDLIPSIALYLVIGSMIACAYSLGKQDEHTQMLLDGYRKVQNAQVAR